jgi:putative CocE/NonD family hydrolase
MSAFLDETVRGRAPAEPVAPVRAFLMGANEWLDLPGWPHPGAVERCWFLDSDGHATSRFGDGRLVDAPPATGSAADEWPHDPDRPVPFITGASSTQIGGPDDFAGVETRGDVLVFTSEALTEALDVIGPVRLVAHVSTSAAVADITAKLLDVHPSGFAQRLCDGSGQAPFPRWPRPRLVRRARHRLPGRGPDVGHLPSGFSAATGSGSRSRARHTPSSR